MKRFLLLPALVMLALTDTATTPVRAGGSDVAAGLIGGLAAGALIRAAGTAPPYYGPPPVYVAPAPARRAGVGWVSGRLDLPCCQSLRITRLAVRLLNAPYPVVQRP